jgi:hypothetical protein
MAKCSTCDSEYKERVVVPSHRVNHRREGNKVVADYKTIVSLTCLCGERQEKRLETITEQAED